MTTHVVSNQNELRGMYGFPPDNSLAVLGELPNLHEHHQAFIALSPFLIIATADESGFPDVSPRGDMPGFVAIHDERTLVIPDRPGNKKIITLSNIMVNPRVALIFFIPGRTDSLRVKGTAHISTDPILLEPLAVKGKSPKSGLIVTVEKAWFHCGKALLRSRLWQAEAQVAPDALPTLGKMLADQIAGVEADEADARLESNNKNRLW